MIWLPLGAPQSSGNASRLSAHGHGVLHRSDDDSSMEPHMLVELRLQHHVATHANRRVAELQRNKSADVAHAYVEARQALALV